MCSALDAANLDRIWESAVTMIKDAIFQLFRLFGGQPGLCKESTLDGTHRTRLTSMRMRRDSAATEQMVKKLTQAGKLAVPLKIQRETCEKVKAYLFSNDQSLTGKGAVSKQAINSCCESLNISPDSAQARTR